MEDQDGPRAPTKTGTSRRRFDRSYKAVVKSISKVSVNEDKLDMLFKDKFMKPKRIW